MIFEVDDETGNRLKKLAAGLAVSAGRGGQRSLHGGLCLGAGAEKTRADAARWRGNAFDDGADDLGDGSDPRVFLQQREGRGAAYSG